ncbi:MAG: hypothetical protein PHG41_06255 [Actinomycetota bacterium]|nr:hypothetical protein [Actinomycetota bacterium]
MLEKLITKWWFYVIVLLIAFVPSITQKSVPPEQTPLIIQEVLQNPLVYKYSVFFPVSKILLIILIAGPLILKNSFRRLFSIFFVILMSIVAIFQNISLETQFGYAILLGNIIIQGIVIITWIYEIKVQKNDFSKINITWWKILCLLLGFFAFWMPSKNGFMHFSFIDLFINEAGLTYCMITPVALSVLLLYYPDVNKVSLRVTALVGLYFGIMNIFTWFVLNAEFWWMGVLHLPLLINSIIGLVCSRSIKSMDSYNTE